MRSFVRAKMFVMWVGIVCVSWLCSIPAMADEVPKVWFVKADAVGSNDGSNWQDAYVDLQDALAAAEAGGQIWVATGMYMPVEPGGRPGEPSGGDRNATFQLLSGVCVYGGFVGTEVTQEERNPAKNLTILSGDLQGNDLDVSLPQDLPTEATRSDNSYHVVTGTGADETAVLDGFVITGGNANGSGHSDGGGMINVSSTAGAIPADPTVVNCTFHGNSARRKGGGVYSSGGSPTFVNCTFRGNHALGSAAIPDGGGGMYNLNASPTVQDCTFRRNTTGGRGAGMYNSGGSQTIIRCLFEENESFISPSDDTRVGGGILSLGSHIVIREGVFAGNIAANGGGVFTGSGTSATIVHTLFYENHAVQPHTVYNRQGDGGALQNYGADLTVIHCTFAGNTAFKSTGAGMSSQNGGSSTVSNCIFWQNVASGVTDSAAQIGDTNPVRVTHSCVQGGWPGEGNIDVDPLFVDPVNGDFHLRSQAGRWHSLTESWIQDDITSPCIDAGDPLSPVGSEPPPHGGVVNMGAYGGTATASRTYVEQQTGDIYTTYNLGQNLGVLNVITGQFRDIGSYELPAATGMSATAFSPDGVLYGMLQGFFERGGMSQLVSIDLHMGKATPVGFSNPINAVAFDFAPDGTAYVAGFTNPDLGMQGDTMLYSIDTNTGQLTAIGDTGIDRIMDFAFDSTGVMWATTANELYTIDPSTGTSQHVVSISGVNTATNDPDAEIMGIMFDEHDVLYATAFIEGSPLFTIDTTTGVATVAVNPGLSFPHGGAMKVR